MNMSKPDILWVLCNAEAHSYGVSYAEDILFVTVKVRNESGDWCAEDENGEPIWR